ncbi:MAG: hypothetical protein ACI8QD_002604 [Cyclobacteriaceae bacterium]|jgi:hypothetical protein
MLYLLVYWLVIGEVCSQWLMYLELAVPIHWAYGEILFFTAITYLIAQIFTRGMELHSESKLTI